MTDFPALFERTRRVACATRCPIQTKGIPNALPASHRSTWLRRSARLNAAINRARKFERETAHLPSTMEKSLPFYRGLLAEHAAVRREANAKRVFVLREGAENLARRLNNGQPGIKACDDAPACMPARLTSEKRGVIPIWGQTGEFTLDVNGMRVHITLDGVFGIGASICFWPSFEARAVDLCKPFISETGYLPKSCLGSVEKIEPVMVRHGRGRGGFERNLVAYRILLREGVTVDVPYAKGQMERVICDDQMIYAIRRFDSALLIVHRLTKAGALVDAVKIQMREAARPAATSWPKLLGVLPRRG